MRKYLTELIGTFFLVLTIGMTVIDPGAGALAPVAIGSSLAGLIYAGRRVSGAHYNPAVTLAVWIRGRCDGWDVAPYIAAQGVGATLASLTVRHVKQVDSIQTKTLAAGPALLAEFVFTTTLVYVILTVATSKASEGNSYYGLAIGLTVTVAAYVVGDISGAALNPSVAGGMCVMGLVAWGDLWIFPAANFSAAAAAALLFRSLHPDDA